MNNLDSMALSKIPYSLRPNSGGYSHGVQTQTLLSRHLRDILCFKKKNVTLFLLKEKLLPIINKKHISIKKQHFFKKSLSYRETTLTVQLINNVHLINHTLISPRPYLERRKNTSIRNFYNRMTKVRKYARLKKTLSYQKILVESCAKNFLNYIETI